MRKNSVQVYLINEGKCVPVTSEVKGNIKAKLQKHACVSITHRKEKKRKRKEKKRKEKTRQMRSAWSPVLKLQSLRAQVTTGRDRSLIILPVRANVALYPLNLAPSSIINFVPQPVRSGKNAGAIRPEERRRGMVSARDFINKDTNSRIANKLTKYWKKPVAICAHL